MPKYRLVDEDTVAVRARDVVKLMEENGWGSKEAAEYYGVSPSHVGSFLRRNGYGPQKGWQPVRGDELRGDERTPAQRFAAAAPDDPENPGVL